MSEDVYDQATRGWCFLCDAPHDPCLGKDEMIPDPDDLEAELVAAERDPDGDVRD